MSASPFQLEFSRPEWLLLLLLVIPLLVWFSGRSLVDLPRRQLRTSLLVRSVIVLLLVLSLAGLNRLTRNADVFTVFVVDQSQSLDPQLAEPAARRFLTAATDGIAAERYTVLPVGREPGEFQTALPDLPAAASAEPPGTNLAAAVEMAAAAVPPGYVPHIVLLTDGNETHGDVLSAATTSGLRVSTVPLPVRDDPELQLTAVNVPAQVAEGEPFRVEVVISANHPDQVQIELFSGDFRIAAETRAVDSGENRFEFTGQVTEPTRYTARIRRPDTTPSANAPDVFQDTLLDNNTASGLVFSSGKPRILLVAADQEPTQNLIWALQEEGLQLTTRPAAGLPADLAQLQNYDAVILANVPATDLTGQQMTALKSYVSEIGGGLLMLGGDQSFGLGGYYKTVVEDVLPVRSDFDKEKEKPGLAMVLVIDKSGSMGGQKIELAKDAAKAAVDLLGVKDQIGVIAFDGSPVWASELRPVTQKGVVIDRIATIEAGGGTSLYPAMEQAFTALQATTAKLKHVILLTDGYSTPGDFAGLTQDMLDARITVSTVGIGDTDQELLKQIADLGNGRFYYTDDPQSIPQIFAKETLTAGKSAINEEPFLPQVMRSTPVLANLDLHAAPFLLGYVVTRTKPTSEVILVTESGDPLLAWWRYGTGISVAFTSDAGSRWAAEWLTWDGFNPFWVQVVRYAMRKSESKGFHLQVQRHGDRATVIVDAADAGGRFLNNVDTELNVIAEGLPTTTLPVPQTAPGRYETQIPLPESGTWHLQVTQRQHDRILHQQTRGLVVGYSDELQLRPVNQELLTAVAAATGGTIDPQPGEVFRPHPGNWAWSATELWPQLLSLAMLLFVVDVALRRLEFRRLFVGPSRVQRSQPQVASDTSNALSAGRQAQEATAAGVERSKQR